MTTGVVMAEAPSGFGAFWKGPLSAFEQACLQTFAAKGFEVTLFSYEPIQNLPEGVRWENAREVADESKSLSYRYAGKPDMAHFSDYFRYKMIKQTNLCWIDADMVALSLAPNLFANEIIAGWSFAGDVNGAILYLPSKIILSCLEKLTALENVELVWGQTGPMVLKTVLAESNVLPKLRPENIFYPISHNDIGSVFLPSELEICRRACADSSCLHVSHSNILRMGYWKDMAPPIGSFLYDIYRETDGLRFFKDIIPASVMERIVINHKNAQTGQALGIKSVVREFVPSIRRTFGHHWVRVMAKKNLRN